jgi:hypothetical protein
MQFCQREQRSWTADIELRGDRILRRAGLRDVVNLTDDDAWKIADSPVGRASWPVMHKG